MSHVSVSYVFIYSCMILCMIHRFRMKIGTETWYIIVDVGDVMSVKSMIYYIHVELCNTHQQH